MAIQISDQACIGAYRKHQQLFAAAEEIGMKWQTLYSRLKKLGEPVCGNKSRWGSSKDRFAAKGEEVFRHLVPFAEDKNLEEHQPKVDFIVNGVLVDVKSAKLIKSHGRYKSKRWAFYLKKQLELADFYVCLCFCESGETLRKLYLVPRDMITGITTLSIPESGTSKWNCFSVEKEDLPEFFIGL